MGQRNFFHIGYGSSPKIAMKDAQQKAMEDGVNPGHSGTILEKHECKQVILPPGFEVGFTVNTSAVVSYADQLLKSGEPEWLQDKHGPAGWIWLSAQGNLESEYLFFGVADY